MKFSIDFYNSSLQVLFFCDFQDFNFSWKFQISKIFTFFWFHQNFYLYNFSKFFELKSFNILIFKEKIEFFIKFCFEINKNNNIINLYGNSDQKSSDFESSEFENSDFEKKFIFVKQVQIYQKSSALSKKFRFVKKKFRFVKKGQIFQKKFRFVKKDQICQKKFRF